MASTTLENKSKLDSYIEYLGSSSPENFLNTCRTVFNSLEAGRSKLVYLRTTDVATMVGIFTRWNSSIATFIAVTENDNFTAYITHNGGVSLSQIKSFEGLTDIASITYVDSQVSPKANKSYVDDQLASKASTTYVDGQVSPKADKTYVDTQVSPKADKTYVDTFGSGVNLFALSPYTATADGYVVLYVNPKTAADTSLMVTGGSYGIIRADSTGGVPVSNVGLVKKNNTITLGHAGGAYETTSVATFIPIH